MGRHAGKERPNFGSVMLWAGIVMFLAVAAVCIIWAVKDGNTYAEQSAVMASGQAVPGTATKIKLAGRKNVELAYTANGEDYTTVVSVSAKIFRKLDGKGADRDKKADVTVYVDPADPQHATIQGEIDTAKSLRNQSIFSACFMGLLWLILVILQIMLLIAEKKSGSGIQQPDRYINGKGVYDLRSDTEKRAEDQAASPLPEPLESYANEIVGLFEQYSEMYERERKLRPIGEKMNNNGKQLQVAYRSQYLANQAGLGDAFSIRYLEYAWDGLGGWRA